jgi:hypothetical protein
MFGAGLLLFVVSFFSRALAGKQDGDSLRGYQCAVGALLVPWDDQIGRAIFGKSPLVYTAIFFSGLINPLLIVTMVLGYWKRFRLLFAILRNTLLGMIPFCWIAFYCGKCYPREGHLLWVGSMALMLFSFKTEASLVRPNSAPNFQS